MVLKGGALVRVVLDQGTFEAGLRADRLLDEGDIDGQRVWMSIIAAIEELQKTEPEGRVH